ncbi:hypothetical protein BCR32DRAFT_264321 [Anaeromyces robustus]|uniref:alpha-galactosidase n=1 Tax=Anaeromyces robustus TaxID=1754192 RepID=A0A1Y1XNR5_9FUNG|nr:hypothetical protein BCR32DRAFT_264321 [Anaeromyces robustus]|eukprot:ORX87400.1 hypothetical protein BCR32DRAFT_264321 [Anaeromyces robustus]
MKFSFLFSIILLNIILIKQAKTSKKVWKPKIGMTWNWILNANSEEIDINEKVDILGVDLFDHSADFIKELKKNGHKIICYFSAGTLEKGRPDTKKFFKIPNLVMNKMSDWDEYYLNIKNSAIKPLMINRLDLAVEKHCDAIEPDNVDIYLSESVKKWRDPVTRQDQINYDIWLSSEARKRGLAIALKNDIDNVITLEPYFDFAINEDCYVYEECYFYSYSFILNKKPVLAVAYGSSCDEDFLVKVKTSVYGRRFSVIIKDPNRLVQKNYLSYVPEKDDMIHMCIKEMAMLNGTNVTSDKKNILLKSVIILV